MNIFASKRSHTAFPLKPVAAGCALLIAAAAAPAYAQAQAAGADIVPIGAQITKDGAEPGYFSVAVKNPASSAASLADGDESTIRGPAQHRRFSVGQVSIERPRGLARQPQRNAPIETDGREVATSRLERDADYSLGMTE